MKKALIITTAILLLLAYTGSYMALSRQGEYVPACWGLGWVKWYVWAPRGFVSGPWGIKQNRLWQTIFLPLWVIDRHVIHTDDKADRGKYPINTRLDQVLHQQLEQLEKQYAAPAGSTNAPPN